MLNKLFSFVIFLSIATTLDEFIILNLTRPIFNTILIKTGLVKNSEEASTLTLKVLFFIGGATTISYGLYKSIHKPTKNKKEDK